MAPRRTARQIVLDAMAEVRDFMPEVERMVEEEFGGRCMHVHPATVRNGKTITPTSVPWPDLSIWFPYAFPRSPSILGPRLHLVELKAHGKGLKRGQPELFASLEAAGCPVPIWEPRDLDDLIPRTLAEWSGRPRQTLLFVPRAKRWKDALKSVAA